VRDRAALVDPTMVWPVGELDGSRGGPTRSPPGSGTGFTARWIEAVPGVVLVGSGRRQSEVDRRGVAGRRRAIVSGLARLCRSD